jgi:tetratricopeptide (TPR) repeat protein
VVPQADVASDVQAALTLHQHGNLEEAAQLYVHALTYDPVNFDALHLLGILRHQQGASVEALRFIATALQARPGSADALINYGVILDATKRHQEALQAFEQALDIRPADATVFYNRGLALRNLGRLDEALESHARAVALAPGHVDALYQHGNILVALSRHEEALADYEKVIALQPMHSAALNRRGNALSALKRFAEACTSYEAALACDGHSLQVLNNLAVTLRELGRPDEALTHYDEMVKLEPNLSGAHCNRGNTLCELKRYDEAILSYERALALQPADAAAHYNKGNALREQLRFDAAIASYDQALALRPNFPSAHCALGLSYLSLGELPRGWRENEWRWETAEMSTARRNFVQPLWLGTEEIAGKTILLHAEQGFGDTLQFCRYAPLVAARGANVILEVPAPLRELMRSLPAVAQVVAEGEPLPAFDFHCPLLSLPLAFNTEIDTIPATARYLTAPEPKLSAWRRRFGEHQKLRVGLVWAGNPRKEVRICNWGDRQRSIPFDQITPLLQIQDCEFYSLQKSEDAVAQLRISLLRDRVIDWTDDFADFADTAALIENLDLVIAVDTSVAHLGAALGKPLWLLNRYNTCWRWLLDRDDSPWYPTLRLFRQDTPGVWDDVIARVRVTLEGCARDYRDRIA